MYKFITLTNGKKVQAFYESEEDKVSDIVGAAFDFKALSDGKLVQKIAFVDVDGNKISLFIVPPIISDGNTVGWYDSSDLTTITKDGSDLVSRWNDKLGSGHDLIQATNKPLWVLNDGILFDGIDNFMKTAAFTFDQPEQIYIVFKQITWTSGRYVFDGNIANVGLCSQSGTTPKLNTNAGLSSPENENLPINTFGIARILFNGVSSSLQINETAKVIANAGALDMSGFTIGTRGDGNVRWSHIQVKEIILRKIADTAPNEQDIYDYLSNKYSI